jgi:ArsR family transcriptional regulator, arsenate/arsenite/antimonite-responsive transcriptional repressor
MADIFDVLADATRRELLVTLHERRVHGGANDELSVGELVERLGLSQPTVSKHLQRLREHGLVSTRSVGQHHYYRLQTAPLHEVESWLHDFLGESTAADEDAAAVFAAWAGADLGGTLGRRLADGTYQARAVVTDASTRVAKRLPRIGKRKPDELGVDTE